MFLIASKKNRICRPASSRGGFLPRLIGGLFAAALALSALATPGAQAAPAAIFGGGPFYSGGTSVMYNVRLSGFTTVILWSIHVNSSNGDLFLNDQRVASNGAYVGDAGWPNRIKSLRQQPTSVNRIELCVGSAGVNDFQTIRTFMNSEGSGSNTILYRNFLALKNALGVDAVGFDDEILFDADATVDFGRMLANMGYKITLVPYNNSSFWQNVKSRLGTAVDAVYLQCYDGGAGNNPSDWNKLFGGLRVTPGLWGLHFNAGAGDSPGTVQNKMLGWRNSAGVTGGFMWLYDDFQNPANRAAPIQYANAIQTAFGDGRPYFKIVNQNSGKALDLISGDLNNGARINQWIYDLNSSNQNWLFIPTEQGNHFILVSAQTGKSACIKDNSNADGTQLHDWDYTGNNGYQQFDLVDKGGGWFALRSVGSGKVLGVLNSSADNDAKLQQETDANKTSQRFRLQPWGDYQIRSDGGKYVCIEGGASSNGSRIIQFDRQNNPWFKWRFESVGGADLKVSSLNALGRVLCVSGGSSTPGVYCHLWDYNPNNFGDQKVRVVPQLSGRYKFFLVHDGQSWDVGGTSINTPVVQNPNNSNGSQQFLPQRQP